MHNEEKSHSSALKSNPIEYCTVEMSKLNHFGHFNLLYLILLRLVMVNIICKICVNFRQEIHESVLQKMRQLNLL